MSQCEVCQARTGSAYLCRDHVKILRRTLERLPWWLSVLEDAGFEMRDSIAWLYGSGFPKSMDVSKAIDKAAGVTRASDYQPNNGNAVFGKGMGGGRTTVSDPPATDAAKQWEGWGTALKPAFEPIVLARKPLRGTVASNVVQHGTGALNIDACRIAAGQEYRDKCASVVGLDSNRNGSAYGEWTGTRDSAHVGGRWPANVLLDETTADQVDQQSGITRDGVAVKRNQVVGSDKPNAVYGKFKNHTTDDEGYGGEGGASRFFPVFKYAAKAPGDERPSVNGVAHPTVKPLELMRWLVRLITPPGGVVLDPFAGSGTTAEACIHEHRTAIVIEREADYLPLIQARLSKPMEIGFNFGEGA